MDDAASLCQAPTADIAAALRERRIGCREMLEAYLQRIEAHNPAINAIVATDLDTARDRADAADAALARGEQWGPLHGVPFTLKDTFDVAGLPTVCGSPSLGAYRPQDDAAAAQRLRAAGAVLFGKTNVPLFAQDLQTYNAVYGTTNNPWNSARTCGGSSGGPAAALAAGLTGGDIGSDIGGSIRTPAHFCGIYGHKPSHGLVSLRGHIPGPPGTLSEPDLAVAGPMGRGASDLPLLLDVLAGPDQLDARGWRVALPQEARTDLRDFRVLAWLDDPHCPVESAQHTVLKDTVEALRRHGAAVQDGPPPGVSLDEAYALYMPLLAAIIGGGLPKKLYRRFGWLAQAARLLGRTRTDRVGGYAVAATQSHRDWLRAHEARERLRRRWEALFEQFDVVLMPVTPMPAFAHQHAGNLFSRRLEIDGRSRPYTDVFPWIAPATLLYLPATVAPVGLSGGLPVGLQILGPYLHDRRTMRFAELMAAACPPPPLPDDPMPAAG